MSLKTERRLEASKRKYEKAMKAFEGIFAHNQTFVEFKPKKNSIEFTTFFRLYMANGTQTQKYRFDYEMEMDGPLPRVGDIRELLWWTLRDWQKAHPEKGNATQMQWYVGAKP